MNEQSSNLWWWVVGVVVIILVLLGIWWWSAAQSPGYSQLGYASTSTDALVSPNNEPTAALAAQTRSGSVVTVAESLPDGTRFASLLENTGVGAQLTGKGPYTIFVPDDESFSLLAPGTLNLTPAQQKRLVEYHIVSGRAIDVDAQSSGTIEALSTDMLNFSIRSSDKSARINSAVALQEYKASNGVVYLVSEVLLPPLGTTQ